ncbi:LacI family DNA-binding transcriptional regulator [Streptomyces pseudovenezuelae]|uniref:DNA-binding LacI/PurR family transcriptional regulator n=1 Tax=Streptomyces pseudovenezuelae TaxID=67350 RepID=A0ABT6LY13_9ACTN|nr:LacI family DNA-binding transcriptional regulator [Streptomyces pseudovenezuelae]MDH6220349.1 DNA-binding LacI/PurR family transcriptional regulator [Streptomyces pseudovenezuelae]
MAGRTGRVTATDVAKEAGVSQTTVSYVLNDAPHQKISEQTRRKVLDAVAKLGYKPSAAARALRLGRSDLVLMFLPDVPVGGSLTALVELLGDELERHGLNLVTRRERHTPLESLWRELAPAAVMTAFDVPEEDVAGMRAAGIHVVSAGMSPSDSPGVLTVPQRLIGTMQVERLATTGHTRIGYATPGDPRLQDFLVLRLEGARAACAELGLEPPVVLEVPLDISAAAAAAERWHSAVPAVTGVCAYNDETAFALLAGMRRVGLSAPGDLAVIGVDNDKLAPFAMPPLTTIDNNLDVVVGRAARMIVNGVTGRSLPTQPQITPLSLVVRESA